MNIVNYVENNELGFAGKINYDVLIKKLCSLNLHYTVNEHLDDVQYSSIAMACKFSKVGSVNLLAIANEEGKVVIQDTNNRKNPVEPVSFCFFRAHNNAVFDIAWSDVDYNLLVGSGDHSVSLWDIGYQSAKPLGVFCEHTKSVKSVCFVPEEKYLFASGARDGLILLWDARSSSPNAGKIKPCNSIKGYNWLSTGTNLKRRGIRKGNTSADSISALCFQNGTTLFSCSAGEGSIKTWDIRKYYSAYKRTPRPVHTLLHPEQYLKNSFTSLCMDPSGCKLFANCMDHSIYCYNVSTYSSQPVAKYTGHEVLSLYIKCCLSPDGVYLLSGSCDSKAYIWRVDKPGPPSFLLNGHYSEVTCVDWSSSPDIQIATCSDDLSPVGSSEMSMGMVWEILSDDVKSMMLSGDPDTPSDIRHLKCTGWAEEVKNKDLTSNQKIITPRRHSTIIKSVNEEHVSPISSLNSPTSNLPNYVIDGTSPHHQCTVSRQKENRNWLSEFQNVTPPTQRLHDLKNKTPPAQSLSSPRCGQKRQRPHNPKVCGNLLKFFKVSIKQKTLTPCNQLNNIKPSNSPPPEC